VRVAGPAGRDRITVRWVVSKRRAQHR
jgi:hypothetical protein